MAGLSFWTSPVKASWDQTGIPQAVFSAAAPAANAAALRYGYRAGGIFAGKVAGELAKRYTKYSPSSTGRSAASRSRWRRSTAGRAHFKLAAMPPGRGYKRRRTGVRTFRRGYNRTGGYYGRFKGKSSSARGSALQEMKFVQFPFDNSNISPLGVTTAILTTIVQGDSEAERIGRRATIRSIAWRINLSLPIQDAKALPVAGNIIRLMIVQDTQCNGVAIPITQLLEAADYQSFNNLANKNRFKTLYDKYHTLNYSGLASDAVGVVSQAAHERFLAIYKKVNIIIEFDNTATTGVISTVRSNNIQAFAISKASGAAMISLVRIRFTDN